MANGNGVGGGDGGGSGDIVRPSGPTGPVGQPSSQPTDRFPGVDLPPTEEPLSYIDDAYSNMLADDDPQVEPQQPRQPQYPQPVQPPVQRMAPQARPQQPAQRSQQPAQPQQPAQQPQVQTPSEQDQLARRAESDPFGLQADMLEQQQQQYIDALAQNAYPISDEDMNAFLSGDGRQVSRALARVHVNAVGSVLRVVSQQMPMWVNNMLKYHQAATDSEGAFWTANPGLDRAQHKDLAWAAARAFRQMNPKADTATFHKVVGAMVAAAAGVPANAQQAPVQQPQYRTAQGVRTPGRVVRSVPQAHSPAGTLPAGGRPGVIDNPWSQTAEIIRADESGVFDNS